MIPGMKQLSYEETNHVSVDIKGEMKQSRSLGKCSKCVKDGSRQNLTIYSVWLTAAKPGDTQPRLIWDVTSSHELLTDGTAWSKVLSNRIPSTSSSLVSIEHDKTRLPSSQTHSLPSHFGLICSIHWIQLWPHLYLVCTIVRLYTMEPKFVFILLSAVR